MNAGYSLYSGNELSTDESSTLDIEMEVLKFGGGICYNFNAARLSFSVAPHNVTNEETASEFSKLVDGKISHSVAISIPFTMDEKNVYLKFLRTEIEDIDSVDFRVSNEMSL